MLPFLRRGVFVTGHTLGADGHRTCAQRGPNLLGLTWQVLSKVAGSRDCADDRTGVRLRSFVVESWEIEQLRRSFAMLPPGHSAAALTKEAAMALVHEVLTSDGPCSAAGKPTPTSPPKPRPRRNPDYFASLYLICPLGSGRPVAPVVEGVVAVRPSVPGWGLRLSPNGEVLAPRVENRRPLTAHNRDNDLRTATLSVEAGSASEPPNPDRR
jgi:hypothetical protein